MRYMLLVHLEGERPAPDTQEGRDAMAANAAFMAHARERGVLVEAGPLEGPESAILVRRSDDVPLLSDGPFAETREWLAGFYLLECDTLEQALEIARSSPGCVPEQTIEIRPLLDTTAVEGMYHR